MEAAGASRGFSGCISLWGSCWLEEFGEIVSVDPRWLCPALCHPWRAAWAASGAWGRAGGTQTKCTGHGAAGSHPVGTSSAQGLLESISLVLSSWESPQCPSEELQLCLGRGNSQTVPWAERASPGLCAWVKGDAVGSSAEMSSGPG